MSFILAKVTTPHLTGLPEDSVTNSFALVPTGSETRVSAAAAFTTELDAFYTALSAYLSSAYIWTAMTVEYVDLLDDRPRLPYVTSSFGTTSVSSSGNDMPAEVAICISYQGLSDSGVNMRRRRGRTYIGPLQMASGDNTIVTPTVSNAFLTAFGNLSANAAYQMCVYSRYEHHGVPVGRNINEKLQNGDPVFPEVPDFLPTSFTPLSSAWVDNAYDTQRRRGPKATLRVSMAV